MHRRSAAGGRGLALASTLLSRRPLRIKRSRLLRPQVLNAGIAAATENQAGNALEAPLVKKCVEHRHVGRGLAIIPSVVVLTWSLRDQPSVTSLLHRIVVGFHGT